MLMGDGNGTLYFPGNGIADFIRTGDGGEDDDMISNTHLSIWPLITEKIHFSLTLTLTFFSTLTSSPFAHHIMNMDQFTRFDFTNRSPNSLPIFDHRPISRYPSKSNFVGKRYFFFRNNFLPF